MAKLTSQELMAQAQKLIEQAKRIEEEEALKIGQAILKLHHLDKIATTDIKQFVSDLLAGKKPRESKAQKEIIANPAEVTTAEPASNIFKNNNY